MHTRRKHLGAAVIDNLVYVVGGRDERSELSSAERQATFLYTHHTFVFLQ